VYLGKMRPGHKPGLSLNRAGAVVIIPARWGSTRFPGKVLSDVYGRPLIHRIVSVCRASREVDEVYVATDDRRVFSAAEEAGARAVMTSRRLRSGSDRVAAVAGRVNAQIIVNVQGDEYFDDPRVLSRLISVLWKDSGIRVATLARPVGAREAADPHLVKVVADRAGNALYFSRSPIPFYRDRKSGANHLGHIGIYAFRRPALLAFARMAKTPLEAAENLEQLRLLERGIGIHVVKTSCLTVGVDTQEDLRKLKSMVRRKRLRLRGDRGRL
jgi:3-deoxy-D-manno-octulosonate cytidylyltransferase